MTNRKFYKTVYEVEVLSEVEIAEGLDLSTIDHMITEGECSGNVSRTVKVLNGEQAAYALRNQGSDPSFFQLDNEGNDIDE